MFLSILETIPLTVPLPLLVGFGFRPVPFALLTDDPDFWRGCQGCRNYGILESNNFKMCLCTGLLYDPEEHIVIENQNNL